MTRLEELESALRRIAEFPAVILAICLGLFFAPSVVFLALAAAKRRRPRRPRPFITPWRAWCFCSNDPKLRTWYVSRKVGETTENLRYPPLGYKDPWTLASFKTGREARRAAAKANADKAN